MGIRVQRVAAVITFAVIVGAPFQARPLSASRAEARCYSLRGIVAVPAGMPSAAGAVVYIEKVRGKTFTASAASYLIEERDYTYIPHVLPVPLGSRVTFVNRDPDAHVTYTVADCCRFNFGEYSAGQSRTVVFDKPGVAEILCNIHPQMGAYVIVLQNPYFAVTDDAGHFEIRDVPASDYTLRVWHEVLPAQSKQIHVTGDDVEVSFTLQAWTNRPVAAESVLPQTHMVRIDAGEFIMGTDDRLPNEAPKRRVRLPAFWVDRTEVTNAAFVEFLNALRHSRDMVDLSDPGCKIRPGKKPGTFVVESGCENLPVVCVSWFGADTYARWLGKRLPTEAEWEKAARGADGREWPWGNEFGAAKANVSTATFVSPGLKPVGSFPVGASPSGCLDMAGNAWEWTASEDSETRQKIIRGGAFDSRPGYARAAVRVTAAPDLRSDKIGFRCAADAKPDEQLRGRDETR
jgi:formylglycine-generating enzyme required for sulfatase activity/plastocyanin